MRIIAHRGNVAGPSDKENHPDHIKEALDKGFDVEVDVWYIDSKFYLGHDKADYLLEMRDAMDLFSDHRVWVHTKNLEAVEHFCTGRGWTKYVNFFWHQTDDFAVTSKNFIWTYFGKQLGERSVAVAPDADTAKGLGLSESFFNVHTYEGAFGVCTDYCLAMQEQLKKDAKHVRFTINEVTAGIQSTGPNLESGVPQQEKDYEKYVYDCACTETTPLSLWEFIYNSKVNPDANKI